MSALRRFILRLWNVFRPGRAEQQLDREMAAHLALFEEDLQRRGLTREQAANAARRAMNVDRVKDLQRDARSFIWLDDAKGDSAVRRAHAGQDTRVHLPGLAHPGARHRVGHGHLQRDPRCAAGSAALSGLGPVRERAACWIAHTGRLRTTLPAAEFLDFQQQSQVFDDVVGTRGESMLLTTTERAEVLRVVRVTPNFFDVMGLSPLLGRAAGPADATPDAPPVAVLRHRAWVSYFGSDPGVVGTTIRLNGEPRTIVGVMPPRFTWHAADVWIPGRDRQERVGCPDRPAQLPGAAEAGRHAAAGRGAAQRHRGAARTHAS